MTGAVRIEYTGVRDLRGPLLFVEGVSGVGWDEFATIVLDSGERRHGLVLEVDRDIAVVQVLQDTAGMNRIGTRVAFSGTPLRIPVGTGWLGRVCNGRGEPADGGPPVLGGAYAEVVGTPINPVRREPPSEAVLTGVGAVDVLTTLVRGQKLPVFSAAGLPHLELAVQITAQATCGVSRSPSCSPAWGSPTPTRRSSAKGWRPARPRGNWSCSSTPPTTR